MKLTVKTLKGAKFVVDVDDSHTVEQVKAAIVRFVCVMVGAAVSLLLA
jgi:hypothetical protein